MMFVFQPEKQTASVVKENVADVKAAVKISTAVSPTEHLSQKKENEPPELLSNEITVDEGKGCEYPGHLYLRFNTKTCDVTNIMKCTCSYFVHFLLNLS